MSGPAGEASSAARARVEVTLLGQSLTLRTSASREYLQQLARYVEERVATLEQGGVRDRLTALGLAALDIADELFRARERERGSDDVRARLDALVNLLDAAATDDPQKA